MACGRYRGRRGGRRDVGSDVLGVRRPVVWSFSVDDFDSSWFSGATSCFVLLPRHAGLSDRAQAGSFGLRAFGRIVRRGGTRHEIQCEPGGNRIAAGGSRGSGIRTVFRYRRWTLGVTILSALAIGIVYNFYLLFFYYQAFTFFSPRGIIGTICELLSAVAFAGFGSWGMYCALRKSGVLSRFASSHKEHNEENA